MRPSVLDAVSSHAWETQPSNVQRRQGRNGGALRALEESPRSGAHPLAERACSEHERTVGEGWISRARCAHDTNPTPTAGSVREGGRVSRDETTRPSRQPLYQGGVRRPGPSGTVTVRERSPQPSHLRRPHPGNPGDDCEASGALKSCWRRQSPVHAFPCGIWCVPERPCSARYLFIIRN